MKVKYGVVFIGFTIINGDIKLYNSKFDITEQKNNLNQ